MCTVSWYFDEAGYELFFNRDELRTRGSGVPPAIAVQAGVRYLAPSDSDRGGTWIGLNEFGLTHCLLNYYQRTVTAADFDPDQTWRSRGELVRIVQASRNLRESAAILQALDLESYPAFWVLAAMPGKGVSGFRWDGTDLKIMHTVTAPASTSGYRPEATTKHRTTRFRKLVGNPPDRTTAVERLWRFHRDRNRLHPSFGVCMTRSDARTVSLTRVSCRRTADTDAPLYAMSYLAEPPCGAKTLPEERYLDPTVSDLTLTR